MSKSRKSRIAFCEWNSASFGAFNTGGIICSNCNFSKSLNKNEKYSSSYQMDNHLLNIKENCANCETNDSLFWLPPIARVPRKKASKRVWKKFWKKLKNRDFNHPEYCR